MRDERVPGPVRRALALEAGMNDIVVLPIVLVLTAIARAEVGGAVGWAVFLLQLFVIGPLAGFAIGGGGSWLMNAVDRRLGIRREYQALYGLGLVLAAYVAGTAVGGDGFLAAFAAGAAVARPFWAPTGVRGPNAPGRHRATPLHRASASSSRYVSP